MVENISQTNVSSIMEYLNEIKEVYKNINVNKNYKGIQSEEDLNLVLKSTQISKDTRKEIIELWRKDPIRNLEKKYGNVNCFPPLSLSLPSMYNKNSKKGRSSMV
jgi:short-subunit dehydrogenase involved in D-alanine esterification of teichoic acids